MSAAAAWALGGALRFAVGICVVALFLATTLSGDAAERFATTAYLAAIFAAITLAVRRALPAAFEQRGHAAPAFPTLLTYTIGVVLCLSIVAALVSYPGVEALVFVGSLASIVVAVLVRCGKMAALITVARAPLVRASIRIAAALQSAHAAVARGGTLLALRRYAVVVALCALGFAALAHRDESDYAEFAYRVMIVATLLFALSTFAPTRAGIWLRDRLARTAGLDDRVSRALAFQRIACYAAVTCIAAMIAASLAASVLAAPFAEGSAIAAYAAAVCATFAVAMECRRLRA